MSTRMQMEIVARQNAESKNRALEQRILELEEERLAQGRTNVEVLSQHGSNSRQYAILTPEEHIDEAHNDPQPENYDNYVQDEENERYGEEDEDLLPCRHGATRSAMNITTPNVQIEENLTPIRPAVAVRSAVHMNTAPSDIHPCLANDSHVAVQESLLPPRTVAARSTINMTTSTNDTHVAAQENLLPPRTVAARSAINMTTTTNDTHAGTGESLQPLRHDVAHSSRNKRTTPTNDGPRFSHDNLVGSDVILFAMLRSDLAVARGTVTSTNPNTMAGGEPLGIEYCEVVVNVVMKRDALLPRAYGDVQTMASALKITIAWPYNKIKECKKKASGPLKSTVGSAPN